MGLPREERESFLAEPHIAALSVAGKEGRAPLTVPIWYAYEPGGDAWILTEAESVKAKRIAEAGRFTLMVDRLEPTVRYVTVEGPATDAVPAKREEIDEMASRYLPSPRAEQYVEWALANLGEHMVIRLRPEHWLSADMGAV
ncbi:pyridoxamine 5'-phosphate oxidase family protein [Streptomyces sp. ODS28]|uniref:pyridoxamine 5'-phosphate oxidase family protein n=1 Tax=Streptomyces sp. ODS28 TaxID=3136688 RepID=UPI0031E5EBCE